MIPQETYYDRIAHNIKIKLALRVRGEVTTKAITNTNGECHISVKIGQDYQILTRAINLEVDSSDSLTSEIYRRYYKNILHKYFTAY